MVDVATHVDFAGACACAVVRSRIVPTNSTFSPVPLAGVKDFLLLSCLSFAVISNISLSRMSMFLTLLLLPESGMASALLSDSK